MKNVTLGPSNIFYFLNILPFSPGGLWTFLVALAHDVSCLLQCTQLTANSFWRPLHKRAICSTHYCLHHYKLWDSKFSFRILFNPKCAVSVNIDWDIVFALWYYYVFFSQKPARIVLYFYSKNSSENPWAKLKINIRNMWKKGFDHDVVLLIFGTRFLAQTATEKHPNKHSVQNKRSLVQECKLI